MKNRKSNDSKNESAGSNASREDKVKFSSLVNQLDSKQLGEMVEIIQRDCPNALTEVFKST